MLIEIHTPYTTVASVKNGEVKLPGVEGELEILSGHQPLVLAISLGSIHINDLDKGTNEEFIVSFGNCLVEGEKCSVLVEHALKFKEVDKASLTLRKEELQKQLDAQSDKETAKASKITNEIDYLNNILYRLP